MAGVQVGVGYIDIRPDVSRFGSQLRTELGTSVSAAGSQASTAITSSLTKGAAGLAGAFVATKVVGFFKGAVSAANESNKVMAQSTAVLRSTGGVANVTAQQIDELATSISKKTGIDDEQIASAENLILTFTNIRNAAGKNNDIFTQTTKIAVDMGAALGGDAASNAILLGKALNDPVAGLSALTRVGVAFTDQQKDQIKTLVATGHTMDAQKIILAELNREFGGSAEAQATAVDKLGVAANNFKESLGNAVLPAVNLVVPAISHLFDAFAALPGPVRTVVGGLVVLTAAVSAVGIGIGILRPKIAAARVQLTEMGVAGGRASTAMGLLGKTVGGLAIIAGVVGLFQSIRKSMDDTTGAINRMSGAADKQLANTFTQIYSGGLKSERAAGQLKLFRQLAEANIGTAQRVVTVLKSQGENTDKYQKILDEVSAAQRQANKDTAAGTDILGQNVPATEDATAAVDKLRTVLMSATDAERDKADATRAVATAERGLTDARRDLAELLKDGAVDEEKIADARRSLADATRSAADANRGLTKAQKEYDQALASANILGTDAANDDLADAAEGLADAQDTAASAHERAAEAAKDLREAQAGDPEYQSKLADARQKVADATDGVADANYNLEQRTYAAITATNLQTDALKTQGEQVKTLFAELNQLLKDHPELAGILGPQIAKLAPPVVGGSPLTPPPPSGGGLLGLPSSSPADLPAGLASPTTNVQVDMTVLGPAPDPTLLGKAIAWVL